MIFWSTRFVTSLNIRPSGRSEKLNKPVLGVWEDFQEGWYLFECPGFLNVFECIGCILKVFECISFVGEYKIMYVYEQPLFVEVRSIVCVMGSSQSGARDKLSWLVSDGSVCGKYWQAFDVFVHYFENNDQEIRVMFCICCKLAVCDTLFHPT